MRSREEIRKHCQDLFTKEPDAQKRGFKLFVVEIELLLDLRDIMTRLEQKLPVDKKSQP